MGQKINLFIDQWAGVEFIWGKTDCAMMVLRFLDYTHDWELTEQFEDCYGNEKQAREFSTFATSTRQLLKELEFEDVARGFEKEGDILLSSSETGLYHSYIDFGDKVFSTHPKYGARLFPKRVITKNYEVLRCPLK